MKNKEQSTFNLGLVGWPLHQSLSPQLHIAALRARRQTGKYLLYPIPPFPEGAGRASELLQGLRRGELQGLNVTLPHKQSLLPLLDELTPVAAAIGAVNTLFCQDEQLVGDNTDAPGFWNDLARLGLTQFQGHWPGSSPARCAAMVLGAGGAARAVVYALAHAGWVVRVASRRPEQAAQLIASLALANVEEAPFPLADAGRATRGLPTLAALAAAVDMLLLINATPLGSRVYPELSVWPELTPFPPNAVLYDLVSYPAVTPFLRQGHAAGRRGYNGLGMLVEQAALSFEIWTGCSAPLQTMRKAVELL